jgi:predicted lipoprotein with Yx(FWY)xxD motif
MRPRRTNSNSNTFLAIAVAVALSALATVGCGRRRLRRFRRDHPRTAAGGQNATIGAANEGELGTILVDSKGRTLYLFRSDSRSKGTCLGACAGTWPPLRATGKPTVSGRANASLVGTSSRSDGEQQVTYNGHPLYLYAGDEKAGDTRGRGLTDFGAGWYVLSPAGQQISGQAPRSYGSGPGGP